MVERCSLRTWERWVLGVDRSCCRDCAGERSSSRTGVHDRGRAWRHLAEGKRGRRKRPRVRQRGRASLDRRSWNCTRSLRDRRSDSGRLGRTEVGSRRTGASREQQASWWCLEASASPEQRRRWLERGGTGRGPSDREPHADMKEVGRPGRVQAGNLRAHSASEARTNVREKRESV